MADSRDIRLAHIREILADCAVGNQSDLVERLRRDGFECTQSSVSRDLKDLGIEKLDGRYMLPEAARLRAIGVLAAKAAGPNLLVLKTGVGAASLIAVQIDQMSLDPVIGTIAGDDTIFVATASDADQRALCDALGVSA